MPMTTMMKTGLAALFCILFSVVTLQAAAGNPAAQLAKDIYDFGVVYEGPDVYQDIAIKNTGAADLEIIRIGTG